MTLEQKAKRKAEIKAKYQMRRTWEEYADMVDGAVLRGSSLEEDTRHLRQTAESMLAESRY